MVILLGALGIYTCVYNRDFHVVNINKRLIQNVNATSPSDYMFSVIFDAGMNKEKVDVEYNENFRGKESKPFFIFLDYSETILIHLLAMHLV